MPQSQTRREVLWGLGFFAIFVLLTLVLGPAFKARGVRGELGSVFIGMLTAVSYVVLRAAIARRRRLKAEGR